MSISSLPPPTEKLITAAELLTMPNDGRASELVRGRIVEMPPTQLPHGKVCFAIATIIGKYLDTHDVGHGAVNDCGIITRRDPDTVRGADAAFGTYMRLPKDRSTQGYWPVSPEIVFEVLSPSDRPGATLTKVSEYLAAEVSAVVVIDPEEYQVHVYAQNQLPVTLTYSESVALHTYLPAGLPTWNVPVREFFKHLPPPQ